jgi:hypothetical protein
MILPRVGCSGAASSNIRICTFNIRISTLNIRISTSNNWLTI